MNFYASTALVALVFNTSVGVLVWRKSSHAALGRYFGLVSLAVSLWILGCFGQSHFNSKYAYLYDVILYIGAACAPTLYLHFVLTFTDSVEKRKKVLLSSYAGTAFFVLFNVIPSIRPLFISEVSQRYDYRTIADPGPLWFVFIGLYTVCASYCAYLLWIHHKHEIGFRRNQLKYFLGAFLTLCVGGTLYFSLVLDINCPPIDNMFTMTYGLTMTYAILRHRLMDFSLLMRWGLAYFLLVASVLLVLIPIVWIAEFISTRFLGFSRGITTLLIACATVFVLDPLRRNVRRFIDRVIFKSPDFQELLVELESTIHGTHDSVALSTCISTQLKRIWNTDHAGLALWDNANARFAFLPINEFRNETVEKIGEPIQRDDFLVRTLENERRLFPEGVITEDELTALGNRASKGERTTLWKIRRTMRWVGATVCVPLAHDGQLEGFVILGKKKGGNSYTNEDRKFLSHLSQIISEALARIHAHDSSVAA